MRSGLIRLAPRLATQPLAKRSRALAMSSLWLRTGIPTKAGGLDEARVGGDFLKVGHDGVEPFDMPDLEDGAFLPRQRHQFPGLGGVVGHRFFHQGVFARRKNAFGEVEMRVRRRYDAEGISRGEGLVERGEGRDAVFLGDFGGLAGRKVMDAGEVDLAGGSEFGIDAGMFLAQGADPEHRDFK